MTFDPEKIENFIAIFNSSKNKIRNFPGCKSLQLIQSQENPNIILTSSIWEDENSLNNYRKSSLFGDTWAATKKLFIEKPEAISYNLIYWLD
jgi:heme-degrading monooxygenase HmoA